MITAIEANKQADAAIQTLYISAIKDLDELIRDAVKDGEFQVTFECENSDLTDRLLQSSKRMGI